MIFALGCIHSRHGLRVGSRWDTPVRVSQDYCSYKAKAPFYYDWARAGQFRWTISLMSNISLI